MITDIIHVVLALPSQHQIFGIFSTVFCIAAAWVYSHGSNKLKTIILKTISWLSVFNEIVFQLNMIYYDIVSNESKAAEGFLRLFLPSVHW